MKVCFLILISVTQQVVRTLPLNKLTHDAEKHQQVHHMKLGSEGDDWDSEDLSTSPEHWNTPPDGYTTPAGEALDDSLVGNSEDCLQNKVVGCEPPVPANEPILPAHPVFHQMDATPHQVPLQGVQVGTSAVVNDLGNLQGPQMGPPLEQQMGPPMGCQVQPLMGPMAMGPPQMGPLGPSQIGNQGPPQIPLVSNLVPQGPQGPQIGPQCSMVGPQGPHTVPHMGPRVEPPVDEPSTVIYGSGVW